MKIEDLYRKGELSVRSYNACERVEIETIDELLDYYKEYNSFSRIKNCGAKSNFELIGICYKYQGDEYENLKEKFQKENALSPIISKRGVAFLR